MIENIKPKSSIQEILLIILLSIIFAFIYNSVSSKSIPIFKKVDPIQYVSDSELFEKFDYDSTLSRNVSTEQMLKLVQNRKSIIIDARNKEAYDKGHIPGSINIPFLDVFNYVEILNEIPRDTLIVVYCEGLNCELSHNLAEFLKGMKFTRIFHYSDGIEEWIRNQLPLEKVE